MNTRIFDSQLLPDGHLSCPEEFINKKNVQFKVLVIFQETEQEESDLDIEQATTQDTGDEFLTREEIDYYMKLDDI